MDTRDLNSSFHLESDLLTDAAPDLMLKRLELGHSFSLPKIHHFDPEADDCPDITPEDVKRLKQLFLMDDVSRVNPLDVLINAMIKYHDAIDPYINVLKEHKQDVFDLWQYLYKIILELDNAADILKQERFYVMDESLRVQEQLAMENLPKDEAETKKVQDEHMDDLDRRREEISMLGKKMEEIKNAKTLEELNKFDNNPATVIRANVKTTQPPKPLDCWATLFSFFPCSQQEPAAPAVSVNPIQDARELSETRARLLKNYQDEINFKEQNYNERMIPRPQTKYLSELNGIKAKIFYEQVKYFRCQSKEVMLICLRLYVLAFRTYYLAYGEDALAEDKTTPSANKKKIAPLRDNEDKNLIKAEQVVIKAKELFRQMVRDLRMHLNTYYCRQPDRVYFTDYLDNYVHIASSDERDAILAGRGTDEMIEHVFPEYETVDEAFDPSFSAGPDI